MWENIALNIFLGLILVGAVANEKPEGWFSRKPFSPLPASGMAVPGQLSQKCPQTQVLWDKRCRTVSSQLMALEFLFSLYTLYNLEVKEKERKERDREGRERGKREKKC